MRKQFATSIEEDISSEFKIACANYGVNMNVILETFMKSFASGEFELKLKKSAFSIEDKTK